MGRSPVAEAAHALPQVAPRLVLGVDEHPDVDLGQLVRDGIPKVARELVVGAERLLAALRSTSLV